MALANFGNTGMGPELGDLLILAGTFIHNVRIQYKLALAEIPTNNRPNIPVHWGNEPSFTNKCLLAHVNNMALQARHSDKPFPMVRELQEDN